MNLLITGAWQSAEEYIDQARYLGHSVYFMQYEKDDLPCLYEWVEGVICNGLFLYHSIEKFVNLKYIQLTSAGLDRVPIDYVKRHNITLHSARGVYSIPMAEFAVAGVLQLYKQSRFFYKNQNEHKWEKNRNLIELFGKKVCIVGCGSVGNECAKRFSAFGCKVTGVDLYPRDDVNYSRIVNLSELDAQLRVADIIVLTLPLVEDTRHMINSHRLEMLNENAILVNIARGAIVDTDALLRALPKIGGAVLDVFEDEPLDENSPLWEHDNVIITPHNSFVGDGNKERLGSMIIEKLNDFEMPHSSL